MLRAIASAYAAHAACSTAGPRAGIVRSPEGLTRWKARARRSIVTSGIENRAGDDMEQWTAGDERPYLRPHDSRPRTAYLWVAFFLVLAAAGGGGAYYFLQQRQFLGPVGTEEVKGAAEPAAPAAAKAEAPPPDAPAAAVPAPGPAVSLPTLENSDPMMRDAVSGLVGRPAFEAMVYPKELVRRIVATVDNLPRETAPRRVVPLEPVPGALGVSGAGEEVALSSANAARYAPYVRVFETLDVRALAQRYAQSYPLFQRAYAELGFPGRRFHDRLLEAIDDLLEAPQISGPVKLVRPKVFYKFADPELESLSAGQKVMIRMGPENAAKVKAKLRELRRELAARPVG